MYSKNNAAVEKQCCFEAGEMVDCVHIAHNNEHHCSQGQASKVNLSKVILGSLSHSILISKMDIITMLTQMLLKERAALIYEKKSVYGRESEMSPPGPTYYEKSDSQSFYLS